jgi:hypothetical protein
MRYQPTAHTLQQRWLLIVCCRFSRRQPPDLRHIDKLVFNAGKARRYSPHGLALFSATVVAQQLPGNSNQEPFEKRFREEGGSETNFPTQWMFLKAVTRSPHGCPSRARGASVSECRTSPDF